MIRTRWALATLLATCLVGACSDDDPKPDIADHPTPSASSRRATVSTSPTVSATPAFGPEETVRAWVDARNVGACRPAIRPPPRRWPPIVQNLRGLVDRLIDGMVYDSWRPFRDDGLESRRAKVESRRTSNGKVDGGVSSTRPAGPIPESGERTRYYDAEKHT